MPLLDPFAADGFSLTSLTAAINKVPYKPQRLAQLGLFQEQGISTTSCIIEENSGVLTIVPVVPRGGPGTPINDQDRVLRSFTIPHLPETATIMADEVQGVRTFGSENQSEVLTMRRDERLTLMRENIDYTIEYHRVAAVKGQYMNANGALTSLFTEFGVSQQTLAMAFNPSATSASRTKATTIFQYIEDALGGTPFSGVRVLCGATFWTSLLEDQDAKATYLNWQAAADLRGDPRQEFMYNGIMWERYRGTASVLIPATEGYALPEGVRDLFITRFAPANYNETVNTIGLPYYAKAEEMPFGKGIALEAQSNPINLCTRPRAVIKLTVS